MMKKAGSYKIILFILIIIAIVFFVVFKHGNKNKPTGSVANFFNSDSKEIKDELKNFILVEGDDTVQKINLENNKIVEATKLEQNNFSEFIGLPKFGEVDGKSVEQSFVLVSEDKSSAIMIVSKTDLNVKDDDMAASENVEYVCNVSEKKCDPSTLFFQNYEGINVGTSKQADVITWVKWDSAKNLLYGHVSNETLGNSSPVYICNTISKNCQKTVGYDSLESGGIHAVAPTGTFSPSLQKFVLINQYDKPNEETGKRWELLSYQSDDLTKPASKFDISLAINASEDVAYDSVLSVAWSGDEKKVAISTSNKIFMFDFEIGKLKLIYAAPIDAEGNYAFDGTQLSFSNDGNYIVFADSEETVLGDGPEDEQNVEVTNIIKKIDLTKNNEITELVRGNNLSLKF
jgi:hypothetical protein